MDYSYGLTKEYVENISRSKDEPSWMLDKRIESLNLYINMPLPNFGPSLNDLNLEKIKYFKEPNLEESDNWEDIPEEIKDVYTKLGIPEAEKEYLGGVGAQYDSGMVYHRIKESLKKKGVVFENMDTAVKEYPELVKKYFMTDCVPASDHKFTALHGAVWSGGTFIYIPKGVNVEMPLQAYFRMNEPSSGQFEHTLIIADEGSSVHYIEGCSAPKYTSSSIHAGCVEIFVHKNAKVIYSSIENWSKNTYNLNTKKAIVYDDGKIEWLNGNMGSRVTMLYPSSILIGDRSSSESLGIVFAGEGQIQDTGSKVVHIGKDTSSIINSKSLSKNGGVSIYRGFVKVGKKAKNTSSFVNCDSLILDEKSSAVAIPVFSQSNSNGFVSHEAKSGKINSEDLEYVISKGYSEAEATRLLVGGFVSDVFKKLPLEYAIELNKLIDIEMDSM